MKKTAILIDSTITLDSEYQKRNDIFIVPLSINFEDVSYKEMGDAKELTEEVVEKINKIKKIPKTSQPSAQDFLDKYEEIYNQGYERVIGLFLSSKLSGTIQGAKTAADMFKEEHDDIEIDVFDTKLTLLPALIIVKDIINQLESGNEITNEEIQTIIDFYVKEMKILLIVDNLDYLAYGGRIKPSLAAIGNLFGVKPVITLKDGELCEYDKVRSNKKAIQLILEDFEKFTNEHEQLHFGTLNVLNEKGSQKILNQLNKISKSGRSEFEIGSFSSVIANHTGPGTIATFVTPRFYEVENKNSKSKKKNKR